MQGLLQGDHFRLCTVVSILLVFLTVGRVYALDTNAVNSNILFTPKVKSPSTKDLVTISQETIEEIITTSTDYAVRSEEQYVLMAVKKELKSYSDTIESVEREKTLWIRIAAVETGIIVLGSVLGCIILTRGK